jgi:hypothetical protein
MLEPHRRMMGALEAVDGMLLCGISTAYIFAVMISYWPIISNLWGTKRGSNGGRSGEAVYGLRIRAQRARAMQWGGCDVRARLSS